MDLPILYIPEVVLIEDSADDEWLTLRGIDQSKLPCRVSVCRDGAEALSYLQGTLSPPNLIILDSDLPKFNGLEVLVRLQADVATRHVPVVVFSGSDPARTHNAFFEAGARDCVVKPIDPHEYMDAVDNLLRLWLPLPPVVGIPVGSSEATLIGTVSTAGW